jgi:hypothetical protein
MIYNLRLRFTTLHFAQRFFIDDETFMMQYSFNNRCFLSVQQRSNYTCKFRLSPDSLQESQDLRAFRSDRHRMLKMSRQ